MEEKNMKTILLKNKKTQKNVFTTVSQYYHEV